MCGFTFLYNPHLTTEQLRDKIDTSQAALQHRGPDDQGMWFKGPVGISHRRLSIIDLGGSRQPMQDAEGRFVLSYNGEIYNYQELRPQLEPHWSFRTSGDTEVLLAGLVLHGPDFCKKMKGMWAFVFWDRQTQTLILGRDRIGKKPLYYQLLQDGIACASELPALSCLTPSWSEDLDSTADYFRYGFYLPGATAYKGVSELLPGHIAIWRPGEEIRQQPYWQLKLGGFRGTRQEAGEELRYALLRSIKRRLVADVEVGAFLSGGIDSSLIVSLMTHELGARPKTFTIAFPEQSYDESPFARQIARYCQTDHHEETLTAWDQTRLETLLTRHVGQPFADSSLLPTALVAELAARHVKVVLSGDGADEIFSGYQRYQAKALLRWYTRLPAVFRKNLEKCIRALPEPMDHHSRSLLKKAHLFCQTAEKAAANTPYVAPLWYTPDELANLAPSLKNRGHTPPGLPATASLDDLQVMMAMDALIYLPQDILVKVDRATMAHGLEARAPYLDTDLVELAFSLPGHWHRHGLAGKRMLRDTFRNRLPAAIWGRRKQGFAVPVSYWLQGELGKRLSNLLPATASLFNIPAVKEMLANHCSGNNDYSYKLFSIYLYLKWKFSR